MSLGGHFPHCSAWLPVSCLPLSSNGEVDTLSMGKGNPWLVAFANNKNGGKLGGKAVAIGIFHMNYVKTTNVSFYVGNHTDSSQVIISGDHTLVTSVKLMKSVILPISKSV